MSATHRKLSADLNALLEVGLEAECFAEPPRHGHDLHCGLFAVGGARCWRLIGCKATTPGGGAAGAAFASATTTVRMPTAASAMTAGRTMTKPYSGNHSA